MGDSAADVVEGLAASLHERAQGLTATVLGLVLLFVGATTVFAELQGALDRASGVSAGASASGAGLRRCVRGCGLSA